jgi:hypothetical protein
MTTTQETTQKRKPFWMTDEEWNKRNLPQLPDDLSEHVQVPELTEVKHEHVLMEYGVKDGLLNYHFYHRGRKELIDAGHAAMDETRKRFEEKCKGANENDKRVAAQARDLEQQQIARDVNAALEERPWWGGFGEFLGKIFPQVFKFRTGFKVSYFLEVDSWSVAMPEPKTPIPLPADVLEEPAALAEAYAASYELSKSAG